ncbi:MAG: hypothetical protein J6A47_10545, partial [Bacilli bacterium]|nr:hypothetical protein [Bacilli bacterium]
AVDRGRHQSCPVTCPVQAMKLALRYFSEADFGSKEIESKVLIQQPQHPLFLDHHKGHGHRFK